jgi:uncharacterized repeat protein (TIGR03803 family)
MQNHRFGLICSLVVAACCAAPSGALAGGAAEKIIHQFRGGDDGAVPYYGGLISDGAGNAYGTTAIGGGVCSDGGCGTVFKLTNDRKISLLYAFKGGSDGDVPYGGLLLDTAGNLYGTTTSGGGTGCTGYGCGTVFKLAPDGTETVLYAFQGESDGYQPLGTLVMDASGNLEGTTAGGGAYNSNCGQGCGTVFKVQPDGTKTLYQFQGGTDGYGPMGTLVLDSGGNLYGTTTLGGVQCNGIQFGCGTVFELTAGGQESVLYAFQGGADGDEPFSGVIADGSGNLYGTTVDGGVPGCCGTVFKISTSGGPKTVLYSFQGGSDGALPYAGVVMDSDGNLYGTTEVGGGRGCKKLFGTGCGTVFKLTPDGTEAVLYSFSKKHGEFPLAPVLLGRNGTIYGTTSAGGAHKEGVVFELKP